MSKKDCLFDLIKVDKENSSLFDMFNTNTCRRVDMVDLQALLTGGVKAAETMAAKIGIFLKNPVAKIGKGIKGVATYGASLIDEILDKLRQFFEKLRNGEAITQLRAWVDDVLKSTKRELGLGDEVAEFAGSINKKLFAIWKVNLKKGKMNCANCAIAVDATLAGNQASALPWTYIKRMEKGKIVTKISYTEGTHVSVLEKEFGKKFIKNMTVDKIKSTLTVNQRGIIFGYNKNTRIGHVFNVINERGVIKFLDGQTGKSADLVYDYYELLLTN